MVGNCCTGESAADPPSPSRPAPPIFSVGAESLVSGRRGQWTSATELEVSDPTNSSKITMCL